MNLSIIILTYNAKIVTIDMLDSLKTSIDYCNSNLRNFTCEVIVVDNKSSDGVDLYINSYYKWLKLYKLKKNIGFAKGNNYGVSKANKRTEYILFLNPDIILMKDTIYKMYNYIRSSKDIGVATCKVELPNGDIDWDSHRAYPTPWNSLCYFLGLENIFGKYFPKIFGRYHMMHKDLNSLHEVDVCLGAFMIMPRYVGDEIAWWPEDYFLNGEDVDMCYQIKILKHHKIVYNPDTKIIHYKGASKGTKNISKKITTASLNTKKIQIDAGVDAMKIFYNKYYIDKYPRIITVIVKLGFWLLHKKRVLLKKE